MSEPEISVVFIISTINTVTITCLQKHYKAEKQAMRLGLESQHNLNPAPNLTKISTYLSTKLKETLQI